MNEAHAVQVIQTGKDAIDHGHSLFDSRYRFAKSQHPIMK